jgi:hypothetical protein
MPIDPIILLAEEIHTLEKQIHTTCKREGAYDREGMEAVNVMVGRLRALYSELLETMPTSAIGAGELIRIAADRLPFAQGRYASHLYRIAERLGAGERAQADLIWLRALTEALGEDTETAKGTDNRTAKLLALAVKGMALPVVVYRAALPARAPAHDLRTLSSGPGEVALPPFVPRSF